MRSLAELTGIAHDDAGRERSAIAGLALAERNAAAAKAGKPAFSSLADWVAALSRRTVCLTLLAGSGSRWQKSLEAARALPAAQRPRWFDASFDAARPRGLYPVRNFLDGAGNGNLIGGAALDGPRGRIPIAAYSLAAVKGLGRHLVVVRGFEEAIDREILAPLGIAADARRFFTQEAPFGKPLGHGDAAWQCRKLIEGADYVIANFGGDANSRLSILLSLLALDALSAAGTELDLLIPAARIPKPAYPIGLDAAGLPRSFGHAKLQGLAEARTPSNAGAGEAAPAAESTAYTNVGLRLYRAPALVKRLESFRDRFWVPGEGYAIPGNDPAGHEFALDNVDAELAGEGRARILAICRPEELTPAKSLDDVPGFERAIEAVVSESALL